jgi:DNA-binding SARP family transcriptional activator
VELFGGPRLWDGSEWIRLSPFQQALLALVYGHAGERVTRPQVAWLLWEDDDTSPARHRIRQLLHGISLKAKVAPIVATEDILRPADDAYACDLGDYRTALEEASYRIPGELLGSGMAAQLHRPCREYSDWLDAREVALRRDFRRLASVAWDEHSAACRWDQALDAAEGLHAVDAMDERVVTMVIEARARVGRLGGAEAAYASHLEACRQQGTEASPELDHLIERVRSLRPDGGRRKTPAPRDVPFIGRTDALAVGRQMLNRVSEGTFTFLLVSGEAGIGKTRLLAELRKEAILGGFHCLGAEPVELERKIPLNPVLDALRGVELEDPLRAIGEPWKAIVCSMLPAGTIDGPREEIPPIQERSLSRRLLDSFALLFEELSRGTPMLVFIDGLQWADATTLALLQFLQRRWEGGPFGVVASVRPDLLRHEDAVKKYLSRADDDSIMRVELGDITDEEALVFIDAVAGIQLPTATRRHLCDLAGPHPFYLTELTRDFVDNRLQLPARAADTVTLPVSLKQIFDARIRNLSDNARRAAAILAVRARPMRLGGLAKLLDLSLDPCADCVEQLQQWHLVELDRDTVRISHELFRSALYTGLSEARRAVLHGAVALHIEEISDGQSHGELALHFDRAGEASAAIRHANLAAAQSMESGAIAEAAHFFEIVVDNETDPLLRAGATADLARALHMDRQIARANPLLELASTRLRACDDFQRARHMDIRRVEGLAEVGATAVPDLIERLGSIKAEAHEVLDWEAVALALDVELHLLHRTGDVEGIRELFAEMKEVAGKGSAAAACISLGGLALGVLYGDPDRALAAAQQAVALTEYELRRYRFRALNRLILVLIYRGMSFLPESMALAAEARAMARTDGDLELRFNLASNLAVSYLDAGYLDRADHELESAHKALGKADLRLPRLNHSYNLGELALAKGAYAVAADHFAAAEAALDTDTPGHVKELVAAGIGLCALAVGDLQTARKRAEDLAPLPTEWHFDPSTILIFRARLLHHRGECLSAVEYLVTESARFKNRFVLGWIRARIEAAHLANRAGLAIAAAIAEDGLERATALALELRAQEFESQLARAHRLGAG